MDLDLNKKITKLKQNTKYKILRTRQFKKMNKDFFVYKIVSFDVGSGPTVLGEIDNNSVSEIEKSIAWLKNHFSEIDYYIMVMDNRNEFVEDFLSNGPGQKKSHIRANRLLLNFLNSYYVWKNHIRHYCSIEKTLLNAKCKEYLNNSTIKTADAIRNYGVHDSEIIDFISYNVITEKTIMTINTSKIQKSEFSSLRYGQEEEINSWGDEMDVITFVDSLTDLIKKIQSELWGLERDDYNKALESIEYYTPKSEPSSYNCWIEDEKKEQVINIGSILELASEKELLLQDIEVHLNNMYYPGS